MNQADYIKEGKNLLYVNTTGAAIENKDVVALPTGIGIALGNIGVEEEGQLRVVDVWSLPAKTGEAFNFGNQLYWNPTAKYLELGLGVTAKPVQSKEENTGNGTVATVTIGSAAVAEKWTLRCTSASTDGGTFAVIGSNSGRWMDATVGQAYSNDRIGFIINDGSTDFSVGDEFAIEFTQINSPAGMCVEDKVADQSYAKVKIG